MNAIIDKGSDNHMDLLRIKNDKMRKCDEVKVIETGAFGKILERFKEFSTKEEKLAEARHTGTN